MFDTATLVHEFDPGGQVGLTHGTDGCPCKPRNEQAKEAQLPRQTNLVALPRPKKRPNDPEEATTLAELLEQLPDPEGDVHDAVVVNIERARVRRFVRSLPAHELKVIALRYGLIGEPLSCRQVAARLGISHSSVSSIEHRALERLRGMYGLPEAA